MKNKYRFLSLSFAIGAALFSVQAVATQTWQDIQAPEIFDNERAQTICPEALAQWRKKTVLRKPVQQGGTDNGLPKRRILFSVPRHIMFAELTSWNVRSEKKNLWRTVR